MIEICGVKYLSERESSKRYGFSQSWFQSQRYKKIGPKYLKLNNKGRVLYPLNDTDEWFKKSLIEN